MKIKKNLATISLAAGVVLGVFLLSRGYIALTRAHGQSIANTPPVTLVLPDCPDTAGQHLNYTSNAMLCGSSTPRTTLTGTTGNIGGSLLLVGGTASGTATIAGAIAGTPCQASASDGTNVLALGLVVQCAVTAPNTATVTLYAIVSLTPAAKSYNVTIP